MDSKYIRQEIPDLGFSVLVGLQGVPDGARGGSMSVQRCGAYIYEPIGLSKIAIQGRKERFFFGFQFIAERIEHQGHRDRGVRHPRHRRDRGDVGDRRDRPLVAVEPWDRRFEKKEKRFRPHRR